MSSQGARLLPGYGQLLMLEMRAKLISSLWRALMLARQNLLRYADSNNPSLPLNLVKPIACP